MFSKCKSYIYILDLEIVPVEKPQVNKFSQMKGTGGGRASTYNNALVKKKNHESPIFPWVCPMHT